MSIVSPLLACGSMHFSAGDLALIYSVLGGWLLSLILALVNPWLIAFLDVRAAYKSAHFIVFAAYVASALVLFAGGFGGLERQAWLIPVFAVPIAVISHFILLVCIHRHIRRSRRAPHAT